MRNLKKAKEWLDFAGKDLRVAEACKDIGEIDIGSYHLQQVVEKSLKALVIFHSIPLPPKKFKTHNIAQLINILENEGIGIPNFVYDAAHFTRYAFEVRYPDDYVPVSKEEYEEAYEIAKRVLEWAKEIIQP